MGQGHDHGTETMNDGRLAAAVAVNILLTLAQIIGGVVSGSLSLIADALQLLAPGGVLYFSCNRQRFKLEPRADWQVRDITAQTLDEDFKRPPPAHRCWRITPAD